MFGRISARIPKFIKKEARIPMFAKLRSKFIKRGPEFQCLKRTNKNYNVSKDTARIPRFRRIALQLRCLQG